MLVPVLPPVPLAQSGGGTTLIDAIKNFFNDAKSVMVYVAPICIFLGFVGVGAMYALSAFPMLNQWKAQNPTAVSALLIGTILMFAAATFSGLIAFS